MKAYKMNHHNYIKTIKSSKAIIHIEILWTIAERFYRRYHKLLDMDLLCDEVIEKLEED